MRFTHFALFSLTTMAGLGLSPAAQANTTDPGSLLVFHEFDNRQGVLTLYTVTNVNDDTLVSSGSNLQAGTIDVEFVYRGRVGLCNPPPDEESGPKHECLIECLEFNRTRRLTPNDTISLLTRADNPEQVQGYMYAFAKRVNTQIAVKFDWLIGNSLVLDGLSVFDYSVNPVVYRAGSALEQGAATDLDSDGLRDLNGAEYEGTTDQILIPRFFGQGRQIHSDLVLINLSGGVEFDATVSFLVYNDNEEVFSAEHKFRCWKKIPLDQISNVFNQDFLRYQTNQDPNEIFGANTTEAGWMRLNGKIAVSQSAAILDPAILAMLVEKIGHFKAAEVPFTLGKQLNGDLLAEGPFGDQ